MKEVSAVSGDFNDKKPFVSDTRRFIRTAACIDIYGGCIPHASAVVFNGVDDRDFAFNITGVQ